MFKASSTPGHYNGLVLQGVACPGWQKTCMTMDSSPSWQLTILRPASRSPSTLYCTDAHDCHKNLTTSVLQRMQQQQKDKQSLKTAVKQAVKYQIMDVTQLQLEVWADNAACCPLYVTRA